jgi:hypothetical protein
MFGTGGLVVVARYRVVGDFNFQGVRQGIIDEFPFFAYLHADLHPHVLAMPFAFLAMGVATPTCTWAVVVARCACLSAIKQLPERLFHWDLGRESFLSSAVILGGMFLLNPGFPHLSLPWSPRHTR